jgi:hypothetical protein
MSAIDLTEKIDRIRDRYGARYWASDEALQEMIAHWGNPPCNDCGVFDIGHEGHICIKSDSNKYWYGEIILASAPNGWHTFAVCWWYGLGGGGSYPSVWNRVAFTTRDEAIEAAMNKLIEIFKGVRDQTGSVPASQSADAERMLKALKAYTQQARQMILL